MKPTIELLGMAIPTYSVMMVLAYVIAWLIATLNVRRVARRGGELEARQMFDFILVLVLASLLGSKIGHTLFEAKGHELSDGRIATGVWDLLKDSPWHWAEIFEPGFVWYGGMVAALLSAVYYFFRRPHLNGWLYADAAAPAIAAGAFIGRLGCFLAGCCYGQPTDVAWGVRFPGMSGAVHPTQLYDAFAALVLFVPLEVRFSRRRFDGEGISLLLIGYSILRALTEAFRGDEDRGSFGPLSTSQWISGLVFVAGIVVFVMRRRSARGPVGLDPTP